tara:strand:+ start:191 stop:520 length:330 start_codon:yes stop_codon:yes gene_type:complete
LDPSLKIGSGINRPLLFKKTESINSRLSFGLGKALRTAKYQKKICSKSGIFLIISIYASAIFAINQFEDNRIIPTVKPIIVAKKIPIPATSNVFKRPTIKASKYEEVGE